MAGGFSALFLAKLAKGAMNGVKRFLAKLAKDARIRGSRMFLIIAAASWEQVAEAGFTGRGM